MFLPHSLLSFFANAQALKITPVLSHRFVVRTQQRGLLVVGACHLPFSQAVVNDAQLQQRNSPAVIPLDKRARALIFL